MDEYAKYQMLYCDEGLCRVNTFERGEGSTAGHCPACGRLGLPIPERHRG